MAPIKRSATFTLEPTSSKKKKAAKPAYRVLPKITNFRSGAMPAQYIADLEFTGIGTLTTTASVGPTTQVYRANDLYDPYFTGAGHQPRGFDQLMNFFNHFTVLSSTARTDFIYQTDAATAGAICAVNLNDISTPVLDPATWTEIPRTKYKVAKVNGGAATVVYNKYDTRQFFGVTSPTQSLQHQGSASSSPSEQAFYIVGCEGLPNNQVVTVQYKITIRYKAIFHGPKSVGQS